MTVVTRNYLLLPPELVRLGYELGWPEILRRAQEWDRLIATAYRHEGIRAVLFEDGAALVWPRGEGDSADARNAAVGKAPGGVTTRGRDEG